MEGRGQVVSPLAKGPKTIREGTKRNLKVAYRQIGFYHITNLHE